MTDTVKCKKIGNYILTKTLGKGTFGKVQTGIHCLTQKKVAVKILDKDKIKVQTDVERIIREIKILKKMRHINVIQLFDTISTKKHFYLITEFIKGGDLYDYLSAQNQLSEREVCRLFQQLISAVEYIHKLGIVHRDIKPENILVDFESKTLKLVDFGLSNIYEKDQKLKTPCGSPCYAAPEMIAGKSYNGLLSDIWSSGVVLYCMLCGELPFDDTNIKSLYYKITNGIYTIPSFISPEAQDLIRNLLNINVDKRFNIKNIRSHPWFNIESEQIEEKCIIPDLESIQVDDEIVDIMIDNFFNDGSKVPTKKEIRENISRNKHNEITTVYYLTLNETNKSRNVSKDHIKDSNLTSDNNKLKPKGKTNNLLEVKESPKLIASTGGEKEDSIQNKLKINIKNIKKEIKPFSAKIANIIQGSKEKEKETYQHNTIFSNTKNENNSSDNSNLITPSSNNNKDSSSFNKESITINININKKNYDKKIKVFQTININQIIKNLHTNKETDKKKAITNQVKSPIIQSKPPNSINIVNLLNKFANDIKNKKNNNNTTVIHLSKSKEKEKNIPPETKSIMQTFFKNNNISSVLGRNNKNNIQSNLSKQTNTYNINSVIRTNTISSLRSNTKTPVLTSLTKNAHSKLLDSSHQNNKSSMNDGNINSIAQKLKESFNKRKTNSFAINKETAGPSSIKHSLIKKPTNRNFEINSPSQNIDKPQISIIQGINKNIKLINHRPSSITKRPLNQTSIFQNTSVEKNQSRFEETMNNKKILTKNPFAYNNNQMSKSIKYNQFKFYAGKKGVNLEKKDESSFFHKTNISKY